MDVKHCLRKRLKLERFVFTKWSVFSLSLVLLFVTEIILLTLIIIGLHLVWYSLCVKCYRQLVEIKPNQVAARTDFIKILCSAILINILCYA